MILPGTQKYAILGCSNQQPRSSRLGKLVPVVSLVLAWLARMNCTEEPGQMDLQENAHLGCEAESGCSPWRKRSWIPAGLAAIEKETIKFFSISGAYINIEATADGESRVSKNQNRDYTLYLNRYKKSLLPPKILPGIEYGIIRLSRDAEDHTNPESNICNIQALMNILFLFKESFLKRLVIDRMDYTKRQIKEACALAKRERKEQEKEIEIEHAKRLAKKVLSGISGQQEENRGPCNDEPEPAKDRGSSNTHSKDEATSSPLAVVSLSDAPVTSHEKILQLEIGRSTEDFVRYFMKSFRYIAEKFSLKISYCPAKDLGFLNCVRAKKKVVALILYNLHHLKVLNQDLTSMFPKLKVLSLISLPETYRIKGSVLSKILKNNYSILSIDFFLFNKHKVQVKAEKLVLNGASVQQLRKEQFGLVQFQMPKILGIAYGDKTPATEEAITTALNWVNTRSPFIGKFFIYFYSMSKELESEKLRYFKKNLFLTHGIIKASVKILHYKSNAEKTIELRNVPQSISKSPDGWIPTVPVEILDEWIRETNRPEDLSKECCICLSPYQQKPPDTQVTDENQTASNGSENEGENPVQNSSGHSSTESTQQSKSKKQCVTTPNAEPATAEEDDEDPVVHDVVFFGCNHTLCLSCMISLIRSSLTSSIFSIKCPLCRSPQPFFGFGCIGKDPNGKFVSRIDAKEASKRVENAQEDEFLWFLPIHLAENW